MAYQALSRGACRYIDAGKARRMTGYLIHRDDLIKRELDRVMRGAVWEVWESDFGVNIGLITTMAKNMADYLQGLPKETVKVSVVRLKKALGLADVPNMTFQLVRAKATEEAPWTLEGRSLIRLF